jgi:hypothetical protein
MSERIDQGQSQARAVSCCIDRCRVPDRVVGGGPRGGVGRHEVARRDGKMGGRGSEVVG